MTGSDTDPRDEIGGWRKREFAALRMMEALVAKSAWPGEVKPINGEKPADARTRQREAIDRWVENRAELAASLADAMFDFLQLPSGAPAPDRRKARDGE